MNQDEAHRVLDALDDALADHDVAEAMAWPEQRWESNGEPEPTETIGLGEDIFEQTFEFPRTDKERVAIVGFASGHAHLAPFDDDKTEIWGINQLWKVLPDKHFDRWFELHSLWEFYHANPQHQEFLRKFEGPVYVRAQDYALSQEWGIKTAQPFPDRFLLDRFRPYFNNTISWLVALAIFMSENERRDGKPGYRWLGLYGVDMAQDTALQNEYGHQRPSCEYFIGMAEALGIEVYLPGGADLLKATHLYGYEDSGPVLEKMSSRFQELIRTKEGVRAQMHQLEAQLETMKGTISQLDGAAQEVSYWRKNWLTLPATSAHPGTGDD